MTPNSPPRHLLVLSYVLLAAAGAAALPWASPAVSRAGELFAIVWAAFLLVGGVLAAVAAVRRSWLGEFVGLPLLICVWTVYGLAAGAAVVQGRLSALPGATGLLAVAALLGWRWTGVNIERMASRQVADHEAGEQQ